MIAFVLSLVGKGLKTLALAPFHACGVGYTSEFTFGNVTVARPAHFTSPEQRRVFELVGERIRNWMAPNEMTIAEICLAASISKSTAGIPEAVWRESADVFVMAGVLEVKWLLHLPNLLGERLLPTWDRDGNPLRFRDPSMVLKYPGASVTVSAISTAEKNCMIGTRYAVCALETLGKEETMTTTMFVVLTEEHFSPTYTRPEWVSPIPGRRKR